MSLDKIRREYHGDLFGEDTVNPDPVKQFDIWFQEAVDTSIDDVTAMTLATSTKDGIPSARIVLLKKFDENGFTFFTDYNSRKGEELVINPTAALLFYWKEMDRQIRIEGEIKKVTSVESDEYFNSRPEESRISAIISPQSKNISSRDWLENEYKKFNSENISISRPNNWGGFRLVPNRIEFWQGRPNRLHDRVVFWWVDEEWTISRLAP